MFRINLSKPTGLALLFPVLLLPVACYGADNVSPYVQSQLKQINERIEVKPGLLVSPEETEQMIKTLSHIIETNPSLAEAYYLRGTAYLQEELPKLAVADFDVSLKLDPSNAKAYWYRGLERYALGNIEGAADDFSAALAHGERHPLLYINLGSAHQRLGKKKEAIQDYDVALKDNPKSWPARFMRSNLYAEIGDYQHSLDDCNLLLADSAVPTSNGPVIRQMKGNALLQLGKYEEAIAELTKAADGLSGKAKGSVIYLRGEAHQKLGENDAASADLELSKQLGFVPRNAAPPDRVVHTEAAQTADMESKIANLVAQARSALPSVKERYLKGLPRGESLSVTTKLRSENSFEQVFVRVSSWQGDTITGVLANSVRIPNHKEGETLQVPESEVLDWTIIKPDGSEEGNVVGKFLDTVNR